MAEKDRKPRIRFKGFADAWEQRKVGELSEKTYGGGTPSTQNEGFWNGEIPWIQSSDIEEGRLYGVTPKKFISQDGLNQSAAQLIPKNSIAIITRVGVGKLAFMPFSYATSQDFVSLSRLTVDPFFTVYACYRRLQTDLNSVQGTSIKGITKEELLSKVIFFPDEPEQRLIGGLFRRLDDLITLHQRKYDKLVDVKKSMLEKMFPQGDEKVPKIRFKGFSDAWEQRKLGEIANIQKGQQLGKAEMNDHGYYYVLNGGIEPSGFSDRYNTPANTISISEGGNSCGYVTFNLECFWSGGHNYTLQNPQLDTIYLYQWLKKQEKTIMALRVGSGLPNIQKSALQDVVVLYPNNNEQRMIATILMRLDNLITLHQRKLEKLKNIKSALLEKMFV